jgi:TfoX/Sxy family transcriptional regulator of competence genes
MPTTQSFLDFVCEQLEGVGAIRQLRMMGEACVYVDEKPIVLICNDTVYLKKLPCLDKFKMTKTAIPYKGASERYVIDPDDKDLFQEIVETVADNTPMPKPKKKM